MSAGFTFRDLAFMGGCAGLSALNRDWVARIIAAGGVTPSATTLRANDVWYAALVTAGIDTKIKVCNTYAPDSLIAAITPLIKGGGSDSWTNNGPFVSGDLTVNGLAGNGTSKYLRTGSNPGPAGMSNGTNHGCIYVHTDDKTSAQAEYGGSSSGTDSWRQYYHYNDNTTIFSNTGNFISTTITAGSLTGYLCQSRTSTTRADLYFANSGTGHSSVKNDTSNVSANALGVTNILVHATNESNTTPSNFSKKRVSFVSCGAIA